MRQPDRKQDLAEERTETAHRRTFLAEQRTYSAWVRTGLAALVTGFAIAKLMGEAGPSWFIRGLGGLFIATGAVTFVLGFWAYRGAMRHLPSEAIEGVPLWVIGGLSFVLVFGAAMGLGLVLLE